MIAASVNLGGTSGMLIKDGAGTLNINSGTQTYKTLKTKAGAGTTNVNVALGSGTTIVDANATTNFTVSQDLLELNIGTVPLAPLASFGGGGSGPGVGVVPEPGSMGLLLTGALGLLARRRRA